MKKHGMVTILSVLAAGVWVFSAGAAEMKKEAPVAAKAAPAPVVKYTEEGAPLPAISIKVVGEDKTFAMDKLGKPAMILFINSACSACRGELSALSGVAEKYKDKMMPLAVTVDFDPQNTVARFPDLGKMPYVLLDGSDFKLATALGFNFTPAIVIVDASGKQVFRKGGYSSGEEGQIAERIVSVLK